tara:strand:+ start:17 stop:343 length:327 start_codon:yes stop_codon:yes gene_type:complete
MNPADAYYYYPKTQAERVMTDSTMLDQVFGIIDRYGVSLFTVLCSFWFILYLTKQSAKEREQWQKRDEESDARLMKLVESSSDALLHVKIALEQNTQAMKEFIRYRKD